MNHHAGHHSPDMQDSIRNSLDCARTCTETIAHCLTLGGEHAAADHIGLLQTCADICGTCANAMLRHVESHPAICAACAEICRRCAASCEQLGDDEAMKRCAEACRRCAESCTKTAA